MDPGSISILLQVVGAFVIGSLLTFRKQVGDALKKIFRIKAGADKAETDTEKDEAGE